MSVFHWQFNVFELINKITKHFRNKTIEFYPKHDAYVIKFYVPCAIPDIKYFI